MSASRWQIAEKPESIGKYTDIVVQNAPYYFRIGNEDVPMQLAQCRFPGLAICNAKL